MKKSLCSSLIATGVVLSTASLGVEATVLIGNLDQPTQATTVVPTDAGWAAQSFVTDGSSYALSSIEVLVGNPVDDPALVVELRAGQIATVGATLATFTPTSLPSGGPSVVTFTSSSAITLDPATTYWFVMGVADSGSFGWSYAVGNATSGSGSLGNYAYSPDAGATWGSFNSDDPYKIRVNVSAVPLPGTAWLFGAGLLTLLGTGRKRESARG